MRDLSSLAEQIRAVRQAQRRFIGRWRMEQVIIGPEVLDHLADEMAAAHRELDDCETGEDTVSADPSFEPRNDPWSYHGSRIWSM